MHTYLHARAHTDFTLALTLTLPFTLTLTLTLTPTLTITITLTHPIPDQRRTASRHRGQTRSTNAPTEASHSEKSSVVALQR